MADKRRVDNIVMEDARIIYKNFSGKEGKYNPPGKRNFCALIDKDLSKKLIDDGWNIKYLRPRDEGDEPQPYIPVAVNYDYNPPKIYIVSSKGKTLLDEDEVNMLDWAEIDTIDLIIRPYFWEVNDKKGIKAYLKTMFVTIIEDEFEKKYADINENDNKSIKSYKQQVEDFVNVENGQPEEVPF